MGEHITEQGEFQSDKYPWCRAGFVPLKLTDPMARPVLWDYAGRREVVDKEFSDDLRTCLVTAGHTSKDGLVAERDALKELIRSVEWIDSDMGKFCPFCGGRPIHFEYCEFLKLHIGD